MDNFDAIQAVSHLAKDSEYFLQVALDTTGRILLSEQEAVQITAKISRQQPIYFGDCFMASDWSKYESQRINAYRNSHPSFTVILHKLEHLTGEYILTKWEFFFISKDSGTCHGIGHPIRTPSSVYIDMDDLFEGVTTTNPSIIDTLLEDKLVGFWEFEYSRPTDSLSQGIGQMLGYTQDELSGPHPISWKKHIHPEDFPKLTQDLSTHFKTQGNIPFKKDFRINFKNDQTIWALGYAKTIEWSTTGHPKKILGCIIDISDRRKEGTLLKEHHSFLNELAFEQSHTLRARVANILGILEILENENHLDEAKKLIQLIRKETKNLDQSLKKSIKDSVEKNKSVEDELSMDH